MNVFKREISSNFKQILGWSVGFSFLVLVFMPFSGAFMEQSQAFLTVIEGMGDTFMKAMNINPDLLFTKLGFYSYLYQFFGLMAAIQGLYFGIHTFSKEINMKTADFLFTKPKTRTSLFLEKIGSALLSLFLTWVVTVLASFIGLYFAKGEEMNFSIFFLLCFTLLFYYILFCFMGVAIATVVGRIKNVIAVSTGLGFVFFLLGMVSSVTGDEKLKYLSPLKYFDSNFILMNGSYENKFLLLTAVLSLLFLCVGYFFYTKRDVPAV